MGMLCIAIMILLCLVPANGTTSGQLHSLPEHLEMIFSLDKLVGEGIWHLRSPTERVKRYLESYEWLVKDAAALNIDTVSPEFIGNPLHVYAVIKRLVLYWPQVNEVMNTHTELKEHIEKIKEAEEWLALPSIEDLEGAADGLGYLQHVYNLSIAHLVTGRIINNFTSVKLDDWDCLRIAEAALKRERYQSGWFWYNHVRSTTKDTGMQDHVEELLKMVIMKHDESWEDTDNYFAFPLSKKPIQPARISDMIELCRGNFKVMHDLKCTLTTKGSPYFILHPVKEETILRDPHISLYYDILSETEAETLKSLAQGKLEKQRGYRNLWHLLLPIHSHPVLASINHRTAYLTGLSNYVAPGGLEKTVKIRNYGISGYLGPHVDVRCKHSGNCPLLEEKGAYEISGDRISTTIFYLNDVEAGGRTVFYYQGVSVAPIKGAALVWFNLFKNGTYDRRVDHAGCPVALGNKWVAGRWLRENENFLKRPCSLNPEE